MKTRPRDWDFYSALSTQHSVLSTQHSALSTFKSEGRRQKDIIEILQTSLNIGQTAVANAANLSFFMVNLSHHLLAQFRQNNPDSGIVYLKAYCRGFRYVREMLKMLPEQPEPILLAQIFAKLTSLGRIHNVSTGVQPS